jgi:amino acid adenylation domain-containing protein
MNNTLSTTAAPAAAATPGVRDQLAKLLRAKVARDTIYPLSPAQLSMWFHQALERDSASFNMPFAFCIRGADLQPDIVRQSLESLVARHAVLRTVFEMENDEVVQRVKPTLAFSMPLRDEAARMGEQWRAQVVALSKALSVDAFDLNSGPMFRFELVRVSKDMHVLLATFHHIVMDGWSVGVFLGDFAKAYVAFRDTKAAPAWDALPVSYGDYAKQRHVASRQPEAALATDYWRNRLKDAPEALSLPADFARPAVQTFNGAIVEVALPLGLKQQMTDLARANGATFFMVSLAAFYVLMARLSGQWDLILGVASANRAQPGHHGLLGLFSEILPMRAVIDPHLSFLDFLEALKRDCLNDYEHAAPSLTELAGAMSGNRDARRSNLFQVGFDYQNTPWPALGDVITLLHGDTGAAKLDLNLNLSTVTTGMLAQFEYNTDVFSAQAMTVFANCFQTLLESVVRDPFTHLASLKMTLATPVPALEAPAATGPNVLELIDMRVAAAPHAVAVVDAAGAVSYATLMDRANALAATLRQHGAGAGAGKRIGLCCERSTGMIVAMLAILKTGAAYVPMDASFPLARLEYIVADASLGVVVTSDSRLAELAGLGGVTLITEQADCGATGATHCVRPNASLADSDLAYVLYTSGTTGQPKGVMVSHGALRHFVAPAIERLALDAADTMLQFASISFDASVEEIFPTLAAGATLLMRAPGMIGSIDAFLAMCGENGVTVLDLPTAFWHELVDALAAPAGPRLPATIRLVIIGGEAASPKMLASWLASVGRKVALHNTYGPTETTVCVTTAELSALEVDAAKSVGLPIGRANEHVQIYVLDERGVRAPAGVYGEIFIGGDTVASGYLGRAELTSQKFVIDTFRPRAGGMLFRSGDYGRVAADGRLEFKGRKDNQIKLRGFRVELGEVEAIIGAHPDVHQVCADLRDAADESRRSLVAFVVLNEGATLTAPVLKRWLAERSPDYLVPSALQMVEKFPCGVTGKIDRTALLAMLAVLAPSAVVAPQHTRAPTATEEIVIGIWEGVLGATGLGLGIEDSFFERGGHSLLMIKMLSRVRRLLDADVPLAQVFEAPTVAQFAARVDALRQAGRDAVAPITRRPRGDGGSFPQSFAQQRLWFHEKLNPETASYNVPVAFTARGQLARDVFAASIEELVGRHDILRTTFSERHGQPLQCIGAACRVKLGFTDLSALPEAARAIELDALTAAQANARFDLERGPLLRAAVYQLTSDEFVIAFVFHHMIVDDWSMTLFLGELREIYSARLAGGASAAREPGLQYADFSAWQREQAAGEGAQAQLAFWQGALAGAPDLLQLPTDRPRPAMQRHAGAAHSWTLAPELAGNLRSFARRSGVTLHMVLLSAWVAALSRLSGQKDIVVGIPVANRAHSELENLIGFFVNTLPLRVRVGESDTLLELLGQVKSNSLAAYTNQSVPLERIVEAVRPQRGLGFNPLFVNMFALQNISSAAFTLGQLTLSPRDVEDRQSKVDVSMIFSDTGDDITGTLEYALDLYDRSTMERWSGFVTRMLEALAANAAQPLARTAMCTPDAMTALLERVNGGGAVALHGQTLPELFALQAMRTPDALAIVDGADHCTYRELDARANQLARELVGMGVTRDSIVALAVSRSAAMVAGMLAILKAGGAYLPLDVTLPAKRLAYMLDDSKAALMLADHRCGTAVRALAAKVLCLDADAGRIAAHACGPLERVCARVCAPQSRDLAYVIYTSGSTGEPKGVMIEHGAAATQIVAVRDALGVGAGDRMLQFASSSFDVCVQEVFATVVSGAALVLRDEACLASAAAFWAFCASNAVTIIDIPTRFWHELTFDRATACPPCVRTLLIGGEAVQRSALEAWFDGAGHRPCVFNMYGPTETTINASMQRLSADRAGWDSIGKPFGASIAYILDANGQLAAPGVCGELFIGGVGVARGYLGRPELTRERFVADPFVGGEARMYASGDVASWRDNGEIVYLGRADAQIKLRGFRIDLGEIEHQLTQLALVRSALVLAQENASGEKHLVAYVTLAGAPTLAAGTLAASLLHALKLTLPDYMLPSGILILPELPLTSNGKIAVEALPAMTWVVSGADYLAPGTDTEIALAEIWAGLLDAPVATIGLAANFFELGGHSLLSMRLGSEVRAAFGVEISIRDIFGFGRLVELASRIDTLRAAQRPHLAAQAGETLLAGWV